ncbi:hypothetical protein PBY51_011247 [Eleginops maclovinus]|uniref:A kinase-anchoring proteins AKAP-5 and AKAP-12 calmodulin (CaM)-binding domain-containing protein n=2 Tax=Eleginops maclovinus TaxID=56733 RepID=A0AAN7XBS7_ELEMC|nr:hypothetical protein PBY51_011247 [Eleginops maclovinus]
MTEMDAKQNDINESFRRFFSKVGLKLTVRSGSGDVASDDPNREEPNRPEDFEETTKETTSENPEQNTDVNMAQETYDNDSTTCPTLTDVTSEDLPRNAEEKTTPKQEVESVNGDAEMPVAEDAPQEATPEEEPQPTSPSGPGEEEIVSPIKRFFTTGIFSGLQKKKKPPEEETTDKELEDLGNKEVVETTEQTEDQHQDKEDIGVEAAAVETELKGEIQPAAHTVDPLTIIVTEPDILSSQEKDKVQASPLKRLFSGSNLNKVPKKQRSRRSSDARMSDSGEHVSDKVISSTESFENQKGEVRAQCSAEEEEGAWASFKKLMTPKKLRKRPSLSNEETKIKCLAEEPKPVEGGQISDHSTEESNIRKDSSVSWESVLCGSGRRRSRKTSDSEEETPPNDSEKNKQDTGSKGGAESGLESANEADDSVAHSPKQAGSPSEGDSGSTWKSLKRLITPKRKAKDEVESKDGVQSDSESTHDESSFSIKKLLPGRKKRKSTEKQDQVSSDEADRDAASGDEDSDTPAVVPLSEFDIAETAVPIQTQVDIETHTPKEADQELQQDRLDQKAEPVLQGDSLQAEAMTVQDKDDALESKAPASPATDEESEDTESLSKPQLSDIPEEATPASLTEEAARDDTIAEDLVEITSEAITAPEPLDTTQGDETEMISAVSQLSSESSKTSGNTTPVPAECVVKETDTLLHQVVESISISPKVVPVCSDDVRSNTVVVSVSHQIMETSVKKGLTVLELHKGLDATVINPDLDLEELEAIDKLTASAQTESISEVNDSVSTEIVSEVHTEEFYTADIALDDVHDVDVTHPEQSLKELESVDEIYQLGDCLSEVHAAASTDMLPQGDVVPEEGSVVEAHLSETEPPKNDPQEAAGIEAEETRDEAMEQVQSTEKEDLMHNVTDQIQVEDKEPPLDPEEGSVQSPENDIISEDKPAAETHELKEEKVALTEVNVDPEKKDALETVAFKPEHVQEQEASEAVQTSTLVSEEGRDQSPAEEVQPEDFPEAEAVTDQLKQTEECLAEVSVEPEKKEHQTSVAKTVQELESVEAVQPLTLDSAEGSVQSLDREVISENHTGEPEEETTPLTEANLQQMDAAQTNHVQEQEVVQEVVQAAQAGLDSEDGSVQLHEKEDDAEAETVSEEPKEDSLHLTEGIIEPVDASRTGEEPEVLQAEKASASASEGGSLLSLEKEEIPGDISAVEAGTDEPKAPPSESPEVSVQSPENDIISEDVPEPEKVIDEAKEETIPCTEANLEPAVASTTQNIPEPVVSEAVEAPTSDPAEDSIHLLEKEVISEDASVAETITDESRKEPEVEPEENIKTEHVLAPGILGTVRVPALDSVEGGVQSFAKDVESEDITKVTDEPKAVQASRSDSEVGSPISLEKEVIPEDIPDAEPFTEEPRDDAITPLKVPSEPVESSKSGDIQEPEEVQAVKESDSETGSLPSIEKEAVSEDVPEQKTISDEPQEETIPCTEANDDTSRTVEQQEVLQAEQAPASGPEVGSLQSLVLISEVIQQWKQLQMNPSRDTEVEPEGRLPEEAAKTEPVQDPKVLPSDSKDKVTETKADGGTSMDVQEVPEAIEGGNAQEAILKEDGPKPDVDHVIASVTNGMESEAVAQLDTPLEIAEDQKTGSIPQDVGVEQEDCVPEVVDELQALAAVSVSVVNEEASKVQVLEKTVLTEQPPAPSEDTATVTNEPNHEVMLCAVQATVETEKESELPGTETSSAFEHAVVAQVVVCKDASVAIPDVLEEKTSAIPEPLISKAASEQEFKDEVETSTPLLKGSMLVMMHGPSVESEDRHRVQVQVVDVDVKSAETIGDSLLEVGVTEEKEVIDVCHETLTKVEDFSATPEIEDELTNEELKVTIVEVVPQVKETLQEAEPESVVEQECVNQPDAVTDGVEGEVEGQKAMEDSSETFRERQEEAAAVVSEVSATEQVPKVLLQTLPESSGTSILEQKQNSEGTKSKQEKCKPGFAVEEVKLDQIIHEESQIIQSPVVTHSTAGIASPQNTAIISASNVLDSPSSVSIEFKLNIQYRRANSHAPDMSEVGVQAVEPVEPVSQIQQHESGIQMEVTEGAAQAAELIEPAVNSESTERAVMSTPAVLLDINIQALETVEALEQIKPTERLTSSVQAAETIQPVKQSEKRGASLSPPVICAASDRVEEPVKPKEEEHELDVWMDAEEDIQEVPHNEEEEILEPCVGNEEEEKAGLELEMEEERQHKTAETVEVESDEDFAVALENPDPETVCVTTM